MGVCPGSCGMRSTDTSRLSTASMLILLFFRAMHGFVPGPVLAILTRLAAAIQWKGFENDGRHDRVCNEGFSRAERASVNPLRPPTPTLPVQMEIVPYHAHVQVEHIPAYALAGLGDDCGRIPHEGAAVDGIGLQPRSRTLGHGMRLVACMVPGDLRPYSHRNVIQFK